MRLIATPIAGLWEIETQPVGDHRGSFTRLFCDRSLVPLRPGLRFTQTNLSVTARRGTLRGLHFQRAPCADAKMVRCLRGRVFDVAVDLRHDSPTFGRWHATELRDDNHRQIFIPEGFAHGFQTLTDDAHLLYQHTASHTPTSEGGVRYDDPDLAIDWPLPVTELSDRDRRHPPLDRHFEPLQP